jgi:hypothetical protein
MTSVNTTKQVLQGALGDAADDESSSSLAVLMK